MTHWIETLLTRATDVPPCADVAEWWPRNQELSRVVARPIDRAILGGFAADRVAWAFAGACQAALRALVPSLPMDQIAAFCVTEADGNAPRAIRSELRRSERGGWILNGAKRWATLGSGGTIFLVVARDASQNAEQPALRVARVVAGSPGLGVEVMPATTFVPEVPHARLSFNDVQVTDEALLPGDGYLRYVKPFRSLEDAYVQAAVLAYLVREARSQNWPRPWIEQALETLVALASIAELDPAASTTHVVLAGALSSVERLAADADGYWLSSPNDERRQRWKRDRALLGLAAHARTQRTASAWKRTSLTER